MGRTHAWRNTRESLVEEQYVHVGPVLRGVVRRFSANRSSGRQPGRRAGITAPFAVPPPENRPPSSARIRRQMSITRNRK